MFVWRSIIFYSLFSTFAYYNQKWSRDFRGGSQAFGLFVGGAGLPNSGVKKETNILHPNLVALTITLSGAACRSYEIIRKDKAMKGANRLFAACALGFLAISQQGAASPLAEVAEGLAVLDGSVQMLEKGAPIAKSALTQTLGSRATVTPTATLYGGFELRSTALVYILVRGNSLGTLGVTQAYLDAPRVRIYNSQGRDLIFAQNGTAGFSFCVSTTAVNQAVYDYYLSVRGQPAHSRDMCYGATFAQGAYTFSVTPSIPGVTSVTATSSPPFGEVLFEVTLGP